VQHNVCPTCLGQRYKPEILDIRYNDFNIIEILDNPVSELSNVFDDKKLQFAFEIVQKLGLSHISLGRTTPTLSGGEAQRLKLAEVLIASYHKIQKGNFLFVLDEPTTGLSAKDTAKIYAIFDEILSFHNSIIVIEHNLEMIKNSDFIIDLGIGSGKEGGKNLFEGQYEDLLKHATSLTAKALKGEHEKIEGNEVDQSSLKEKLYNNGEAPNCNDFYLDNKHFAIEKDFAANYEVVTDNSEHKYFTTKEELFKFVRSLGKHEISFNPFVAELFKYKIVPNGIKKAKLTHLKKLGFKVKNSELDEWKHRVIIGEIEKAYNFGNGWITVTTQKQTYELFTRLVSIQNKIIGTPKINEHTFNLYLNSCVYCDGIGVKQIYDKNLIIKNENQSILDKDFLQFPLKLQLKNVITKFAKEGLFDFTKPFNQLSDEQKNIFLFGFKEYKFLKPKGKVTTLSDYIQWQGLYFYIYQNLEKIDMEMKIRDSKHSQICPFCLSGFKNEVEFYLLDNKRIIDYLII